MIIIEKDEGPKIPYEEMGTKLMFDDQLMLNVKAYQRDYPVHLDIFRDDHGNLVLGTPYGRSPYYVANIDIPEKEYEESEEGEQVPLPIDMGTVTLTLWALSH